MRNELTRSAGNNARAIPANQDAVVARCTHSDPTANAAIGAVDRQLRRMRREAEHIASLRRQGRFTPEMEAEARRRFIGIFRPILEKALQE